jgi:hypothetical protein
MVLDVLLLDSPPKARTQASTRAPLANAGALSIRGGIPACARLAPMRDCGALACPGKTLRSFWLQCAPPKPAGSSPRNVSRSPTSRLLAAGRLKPSRRFPPTKARSGTRGIRGCAAESPQALRLQKAPELTAALQTAGASPSRPQIPPPYPNTAMAGFFWCCGLLHF